MDLMARAQADLDNKKSTTNNRTNIMSLIIFDCLKISLKFKNESDFLLIYHYVVIMV